MTHTFPLPTPFAGTEAKGLSASSALSSVAQFEVGTAKNFVYALMDLNSRQAWMIDSHKGSAQVVRELEAAGYKWRGLFLTHTHWDHVGGLPELGVLLRSRSERASLWVHEAERFRLSSIPEGFDVLPLSDQTPITLGALTLDVLHTPGHSAGECTFGLTADEIYYLFTGDSLFLGDCGRTDLETGSTPELYASLQAIKGWIRDPKRTIVLPGHHYRNERNVTNAVAAWFSDELKTNPALKCESAEALALLP